MLAATLKDLWKGVFAESDTPLRAVRDAHARLAGVSPTGTRIQMNAASHSPEVDAAVRVPDAIFALLRLDVSGLREAEEALRANTSLHAKTWQPVLRRWLAAVDGEATASGELPAASADEDVTAARIFGHAAEVFRLLEQNDLRSALALARSTAEEARKSGVPQAEYIAHVALARVRRYRGQTHMATRILSALGRVAPPAWENWIRWELTLAGGVSSTSQHRAADDLALLFGALRSGSPSDIESACDVLHKSTRSFAPWAHDVDLLLGMLGRSRTDARRISTVDAWTAGEANVTAHGVRHASMDEQALRAFVVARVGTDARRVLAYAMPAEANLQLLSDEDQGGRTEMAISALLLAGQEGLFLDDAFERIYDFEYKEAVHDGVFRVLLTRVRQALGTHAELVREGEFLRIELKRDVCVVDPRDEAENANDVLRAIAQQKKTSAREIADSLKKPLRTVQAELARLVADGACSRMGHGPRVTYVVEDTVFSEATRRKRL